MQRNGDESCCTVPQRETTNVLMHLGWPLNTDSSVSFTHRHARTLKCMCDLRMRAKHIYTHLKNTKTITRHPRLIVSPSPRLHSPIIIILYPPIYYFPPLLSHFWVWKHSWHVLGRGNDITVFVRVQDLGEVGGHGVCILSDVDLRRREEGFKLTEKPKKLDL